MKTKDFMEIRDLPVNMPCSDPEGCKHFKDAMKVTERIEELETELKKHRWIPADEPPDDIDAYKQVQVLEYESEIPTVMTMAEVFLDEGGEAEYWKPIILP